MYSHSILFIGTLFPYWISSVGAPAVTILSSFQGETWIYFFHRYQTKCIYTTNMRNRADGWHQLELWFYIQSCILGPAGCWFAVPHAGKYLDSLVLSHILSLSALLQMLLCGQECQRAMVEFWAALYSAFVHKISKPWQTLENGY